MAFSLYKTSKHSRVYREIVSGVKTGICKTSQIPMHYQSVVDSGDYDTPIDLAEVATDDGSIDGYTIEEMDWHFGIQTAPQAGLEPEQGTIRYGARAGASNFSFKAVSMGYLHYPTRAYTMVGSAFDYTVGTPAWTPITRDLASHASLTSIEVTAVNKVVFPDLWSESGGHQCEVMSSPRGGGLTVEHSVGYGVRDWIQANEPPITAASETHFGVLYEIDISDVPRVYKGGDLLSWGDDFTDEGGEIHLRDGSDNLIAYLPHTGSFRSVGGLVRAATKRFWEDGGTYYMFIGQLYDTWTGYTGQSLHSFELKLAHDRDADSRGRDAKQYYAGYYDLEYDTNNWPRNIALGYYYSYIHRGGWAFYPDIPFNASVSGDSEYAYLRLYHGSSFSLNPSGTTPLVFHTDVGSSSAELFKSGQNKAPLPGTPDWMDSRSEVYSQFTNPGADGGVFGPVDIGLPVEEVAGLSGWAPENRMRIRAHPPHNAGPGHHAFLTAYESVRGLTPVLDIVYTERTAVRKPGVDDTPGLRNRRVSRVGGPGSNDASFRLGEADVPSEGTFDNKNRNRFS